MFIGRQQELKQLQDFKKRKVAGLIVCSGRRRIGKSTLIEHFGNEGEFWEFYGLSPREDLTNQDQLQHFSELLAEKCNISPIKFANWNQAFDLLAKFTENKSIIIFLDEISWMAGKDKDFVGKLKGIWDTKLKKNNKLILVLCGSVSAWIEKNILKDKGFMGRVSLTLHLEELPLYDTNQFWENRSISSYEKFKIIGVTGGIPRYLEEIRPELTAEENIKKMCFTKGGILVEEFDKIFYDIFEKKADNYKKIIQTLALGKLEIKQICEKLNISPSGSISKELQTLMLSGFIARDYVWNNGEKKAKLSKYRLKDNYLRFYLKYIEPKKDLIDKGLYDQLHLEELNQWDTIMGLQFENLVHNNLRSIQQILDISPSAMLSASSYFQKKTLRKESCQIDLLIQTRLTLYVCEIKFRKTIPFSIIEEVSEKIQKLKIEKTVSVRPVLIYQGELSKKIKDANFFSHYISFEDLLTKP